MNEITLSKICPEIFLVQKRQRLPENAMREHDAIFNDLILVAEGTILYNINGIDYCLKAGDMLYVAQGSRKRSFTNSDESFALYSCLFTYRTADGASPPLPLPVNLQTDSAGEIFRLFRQMDTLWTEQTVGGGLAAKGLLLQILGQLLARIGLMQEKRDEYSGHIRKIRRFILLHYREKISSAVLSQLTGLNPSYLSRLFSQKTGLTIRAFINDIRIRKAIILLESGEYNVSEAAWHSGFDDPLYFSKVFRRIVGVPPSLYIKDEIDRPPEEKPYYELD